MAHIFSIEGADLLQINQVGNIIQSSAYQVGNIIQSSAANAVQYSMILHKWVQELRQNISQMLDPQKTPHTLP